MIVHPAPPSGVARRILALVEPESARPNDLVDAAEVAHRQLRERMVQLLGQGGFDALWARALRETQRQFGLHERSNGEVTETTSERALHLLIRGQDLAEARERLVAVFSRCVALLYTFIGQDLSYRLVQQIWPDVAFGES